MTRKERDKLVSNEKLQNPFSEQTFWDSPEAKRWFGRGEKDENVEDTMSQTIDRMKNAYMNYEGWRSIVSDNDQEDMCTSHDIYRIRSKAMHLAMALNITIQQMTLKT